MLIVLHLAPALAHAEDDADTEIAKRHFLAGTASYQYGDYEGALREFRDAQLAKPLAALEFNIAKCLDRLERYEEAIEAYRRFAIATPNAAEVVESRDRIRVIRARLEARKTLADPLPTKPTAMQAGPSTAPAIDTELRPAQQPTSEPPTTKTSSVATASQTSSVSDSAADASTPVYKKWWLWTVVGVVLVGGGVGLGFGISQSSGPAAPGCATCGFGTLTF